nr:hypothetical protein [Tanacetum cinerariifolium]
MESKVVKDRVEGSKIKVEESSKRAGEDLQQESTKKQKVDDDQKAVELKRCLKIVLINEDDRIFGSTLEHSQSRFKKVQPVDDLDCYLLHTLKTMFKHHIEDSVWKNQQGLAKMYPLINYTLTQMWNDVRLQVDYKVEMAYDLLRLVRR